MNVTLWGCKRWEPVFGEIKHGRGFRQFLLRSLEKVNRERLLIRTGHNLLKLFHFGGRLTPKLPGNGLGGGPVGPIKQASGTVSTSLFGRLSGYLSLKHTGMAVAA